MSAPALAWMRWSQCTVVGTATSAQAGGHELQQRHLGGGVLHGHAVGVEVGVAAAPLELLALGVGEVVDEDLLGERQRPAEPLAADGDPVGEAWRRRRSTSSIGVLAVTAMACSLRSGCRNFAYKLETSAGSRRRRRVGPADRR